MSASLTWNFLGPVALDLAVVAAVDDLREGEGGTVPAARDPAEHEVVTCSDIPQAILTAQVVFIAKPVKSIWSSTTPLLKFLSKRVLYVHAASHS